MIELFNGFQWYHYVLLIFNLLVIFIIIKTAIEPADKYGI